MEGILSQHGLSSSLWEATFLGEDSWRLCSLLQKQREREENASSLSTLRKAVLLLREQADGKRLKELHIWHRLSAGFIFTSSGTAPPSTVQISKSSHAWSPFQWFSAHAPSYHLGLTPPPLHSIDHYPKFSYSFIWVPVDHWPTSKRYHQKSRVWQDTAVTPWVLQQCWLEMGTQ